MEILSCYNLNKHFKAISIDRKFKALKTKIKSGKIQKRAIRKRTRIKGKTERAKTQRRTVK